MKLEKQYEAKKLRLEGRSLRDIAKLLEVSPTSVSSWTKDIELSDKQKENLRNKNPITSLNPEVRLRGTKNSAAIRKKNRDEFFKQGYKEAQINNDLHIAACMLYWGEGSKSNGTASITNSDPNVLSIFTKLLINYFNIDKEHIKIGINCHLGNGKTQQEIEEYWITHLDISKSNMHKTTIVPNKESRKKKIHIYGMCRVYVNRIEILQRILGSIKYYSDRLTA
jgi:hypothetical protein